MLLGGELLVDDAALGLADALDDDLLGSLGRDAPKLLGLDGDVSLTVGKEERVFKKAQVAQVKLHVTF